jgi:hypothetical protein
MWVGNWKLKSYKAGYKNVLTIRRKIPAKVRPCRRHTYQTTRCHTPLAASLKQFSLFFLHTIMNHLRLAFRLRLMTGLPKSYTYSNALSLCSTTSKRPGGMKLHYWRAICSPFWVICWRHILLSVCTVESQSSRNVMFSISNFRGYPQ